MTVGIEKFNATFTQAKVTGGMCRPADPRAFLTVMEKSAIDDVIAELRGEQVAVIECGVDAMPRAWEFDAPQLEYYHCIKQRGQCNPNVRVFAIKFPRSFDIDIVLAAEKIAGENNPEIINMGFHS
jgi:hypothetical protein